MGEKIQPAERLGFLRDLRHLRRLSLPVSYTRTRFNTIGNDEPDNERQGGDHFKIYQGFQSKPADFLHTPRTGNPCYDAAKDDRHDDHPDQVDKRIADEFGRGRKGWEEPSAQNAESNADKYLDI